MDTRRHYTQVSMEQRVTVVTMLLIEWSVEYKPHLQWRMEAYGWRERLWRCTEERCVAWMHRGLESRQQHQIRHNNSIYHHYKRPSIQTHHIARWSDSDSSSITSSMLSDALRWTTAVCLPQRASLWCTPLAMITLHTPEIASFTLQHTGLIEIIRSQRARGPQGKILLSLRHIAEYLMA